MNPTGAYDHQHLTTVSSNPTIRKALLLQTRPDSQTVSFPLQPHYIIQKPNTGPPIPSGRFVREFHTPQETPCICKSGVQQATLLQDEAQVPYHGLAQIAQSTETPKNKGKKKGKNARWQLPSSKESCKAGTEEQGIRAKKTPLPRWMA